MIVIVDYGMGNLKSVQNAFIKVGHEAIITENINQIKKASAIVLPGVGAFRDAIDTLKKNKIDKELIEAVKIRKPFLGICLGMQLLLTFSEEGGLYKGLNLIPGRAKKFHQSVKCPQMGWNTIKYMNHPALDLNPIFKDIPDESYFYFVHSYYCEINDEQIISSLTDYGLIYASSIWKNNLFGVQFHPEKSSTLGLKILENFGELS